MDFSYARIPIVNLAKKQVIDYVYRPIIKIGIKKEFNGNSEYIDYRALIDSGADDCLFPWELADLAGLTIKEANGKVFRGLGSGSIIGYKTDIRLYLGGITVFTEVYFSRNLIGHGILGQRGFFDKFRIRFIYSKKRIEIVEERR